MQFESKNTNVVLFFLWHSTRIPSKEADWGNERATLSKSGLCLDTVYLSTCLTVNRFNICLNIKKKWFKHIDNTFQMRLCLVTLTFDLVCSTNWPYCLIVSCVYCKLDIIYRSFIFAIYYKKIRLQKFKSLANKHWHVIKRTTNYHEWILKIVVKPLSVSFANFCSCKNSTLYSIMWKSI